MTGCRQQRVLVSLFLTPTASFLIHTPFHHLQLIPLSGLILMEDRGRDWVLEKATEFRHESRLSAGSRTQKDRARKASPGIIPSWAFLKYVMPMLGITLSLNRNPR